jgi:hypothetical protein
MLEDYLGGLEGYYFGRYLVAETLSRPFLDPNTIRGFQAIPNIPGVIKDRITFSFDYIVAGLEEKLDKLPAISRESFDELHRKQIEDLRVYLNMRTDGAQLAPRAKGEFYGYSYNSYAKVIDLVNKYWYFEQVLIGAKSKYADRVAALRGVLHVPADEFLMANLKRMSTEYSLTPYNYTTGGMSILKSLEKYEETQAYVRTIVDAVPSKRFTGETMSPLVLDSFYGKANSGDD